jgi:tetratricopeptide (TPR) repeat protein
MCRRIVLLLALFLAATGGRAEVDELVAEGDAWWARRAEGHLGTQAAPEPIAHAVSAYTRALAIAPDDLATRWKLLRALFFEGEYATAASDRKLALFERGRELAEAGLDRLGEQVGGRRRLDELSVADLPAAVPDRTLAARTYFWATVHWGLWGQTRGKLAAARQGVAGTVRDYAERVVALDPAIENAGGHRILGRLHSEAPRIPFVTGWVDHARAVTELERTRALAPGDLLTSLYWADALLEHFPQRRREALQELRAIAVAEPDPDFLVEELRAIGEAEELLAEYGG